MSLEALASGAGASDLFILKEVRNEQLFNVDGFGRGAGWAGNVSLQPSQEPFIARVMTKGCATKRSGVPFRAFGPYWATDVAGARAGDSVVIVGGEGVSGMPEERIRSLAADAMASARHEVSNEKLDADELEVKQAIESLHQGADEADFEKLARHLATATARALSCEFGAVLLSGPPTRLYMADEGWRPVASEAETIAALLPLKQAVTNGILVEQDLSASNFPYPPLSFEDGVVARCVVPLGEGGKLGLLISAHTGHRPRGFTNLCQRVARSMGEAGEPLLRAAISSL